MKKIILYTALILISIFYSRSGFSYQLSAKNFTYVSPSILEFDIYIKGPVPQEYWMGQYVFNFNPNFSNGQIRFYIIP